MEAKYHLRLAGIKDRLREKGKYASHAAAVAEESVRELPDHLFRLKCAEEDLKFFRGLEMTAETDELRELAATWKREMENRIEMHRTSGGV